MITKTPLDILYINSKLENYTLPLLHGNNGYEAAGVDVYSLSVSPDITTRSSTQTPILENTVTFDSLSANASSDTSKIYFDESDISINITNGEYFQTDFNST